MTLYSAGLMHPVSIQTMLLASEWEKVAWQTASEIATYGFEYFKPSVGVDSFFELDKWSCKVNAGTILLSSERRFYALKSRCIVFLMVEIYKSTRIFRRPQDQPNKAFVISISTTPSPLFWTATSLKSLTIQSAPASRTC